MRGVCWMLLILILIRLLMLSPKSSLQTMWLSTGWMSWQWGGLETSWTARPQWVWSVAWRLAGGQPLVVVCAKHWYWCHMSNIFTNDLDGGAECKCYKLRSGWCIGWWCCPSEGLYRLENGLIRTLQFDGGQCKVLCWGKNNARYALGVHLVKAALQKKTWECWWSLSWRCASNAPLWQEGQQHCGLH